MGDYEGMTERERRGLTAVTMLSAATDGLCPWAAWAGSQMWVAPLLALPLCLLAAKGQARLTADGVLAGAEHHGGNRVGRWVRWLYLLLGLFLLAERGVAHGERLTALTDGSGRWLCLAVSGGLCLWLGRGKGAVTARSGRVIFLLAATALGAVLLGLLPRTEPARVLAWDGKAAGVPAAAVGVLSLSGYGVYARCLPIYNKEGAKQRGGWVAALCGALALLCREMVGTLGAGLTARTEAPLLLALGKAAAPMAAVLILCDWLTLTVLAYGCGALLRSLVGWKWGREAAIGATILVAGLLWEQETARAFLSRWALWGGVIGGVAVPVLLLCRKRPQDVEDKRGEKT